MKILMIYILIGCLVGLITEILRAINPDEYVVERPSLIVKILDVVITIAIWPLLILGAIICSVFGVDIDFAIIKRNEDDEDEGDDTEDDSEDTDLT